LENPPLWVWAIIVGAIIASKFIYRWQSTKYFAKEAEEKSRRRINPNDDKTKDMQNSNFYGIVNSRYGANTGAHKYSLRRYYKDYFAVKKKKE
jgi:membrane-bound lytic murein transglycosylase